MLIYRDCRDALVARGKPRELWEVRERILSDKLFALLYRDYFRRVFRVDTLERVVQEVEMVVLPPRVVGALAKITRRVGGFVHGWVSHLGSSDASIGYGGPP